MGKLTEKLPKPMLEVNGKTLLEHKFDALPESVHEIILVVGYLKEAISAKFGDSYQGKKLIYIEQENIIGGTMDALLQAKDHLTEKFLILMGDDIYSKEDINAVVAHDWALLVQRVPDTVIGGRVIISAEHTVVDIIENDPGEGAVSTNMYALDPRIFTFPPVPKKAGSDELGLPQTVVAASKASGIPLHVVEATRWIQITNPDDIEKAEKLLSTSGA
ncbi:MAG: hypothetical protein A2854_03435 [Parcubacteria group bacterium RIFCSPHIGHO2_01_FULL_56_18]|nr:MAG: hypothetical protein A2854_03435 [Parcubacteria group bacterium RIFCSPHIGHO2_01_FULL_56_18]